MLNFKGEYEHTVDPKGRVSIPAAFREALPPEADGTFVITRGLDGCLAVYTLDVWRKVEEDLSRLPQKARRYVRLLASQAWEAKIDEQGRILIPARLLEKAGIKDKITLIGVLNKIELWNPERFREYIEEDDEALEKAAEEFRL